MSAAKVIQKNAASTVKTANAGSPASAASSSTRHSKTDETGKRADVIVKLLKSDYSSFKTDTEDNIRQDCIGEFYYPFRFLQYLPAEGEEVDMGRLLKSREILFLSRLQIVISMSDTKHHCVTKYQTRPRKSMLRLGYLTDAKLTEIQKSARSFTKQQDRVVILLPMSTFQMFVDLLLSLTYTKPWIIEDKNKLLQWSSAPSAGTTVSSKDTSPSKQQAKARSLSTLIPATIKMQESDLCGKIIYERLFVDSDYFFNAELQWLADGVASQIASASPLSTTNSLLLDCKYTKRYQLTILFDDTTTRSSNTSSNGTVIRRDSIVGKLSNEKTKELLKFYSERKLTTLQRGELHILPIGVLFDLIYDLGFTRNPPLNLCQAIQCLHSYAKSRKKEYNLQKIKLTNENKVQLWSFWSGLCSKEEQSEEALFQYCEDKRISYLKGRHYVTEKEKLAFNREFKRQSEGKQNEEDTLEIKEPVQKKRRVHFQENKNEIVVYNMSQETQPENDLTDPFEFPGLPMSSPPTLSHTTGKKRKR